MRAGRAPPILIDLVVFSLSGLADRGVGGILALAGLGQVSPSTSNCAIALTVSW